ncbi:MAG TPA: adenylate/guanylate cyclase domain-containing protein [Terriglobia bacterium]|nr:adenylate/guanylate cyclase domain-containing protein [Terriglobia bacterium]
MDLIHAWRKSRIASTVILGLAAALVVLGMQREGWLDSQERRSLDWRFRAFAEPGRASRDIVIVALDDPSFSSRDMLDNFGRWPWRRELYAGLVHYLHTWGVRAIGIDLIFAGADPHAGDDAQFAEALAERLDVVLAFDLNQGIFQENDPAEENRLRARPARFAMPVEERVPLFLNHYSGIDLPEESFLKRSRIGCVTIQPDSSGPIRAVTPLFRFGDRFYPSFPLAVASLATGGKLQATVRPGPALEFDGRRIPIDSQGRELIRWYGPAYTYKHYSVWQVFNSALESERGQKPDIPPEAFRNKIVLIGATAAGTDLHANAFSANFPGVEIHATVIDNLLKGDFLRVADPRASLVAILGLALLMAGVVYAVDSAVTHTLLAALASLAYLAIVAGFFTARHVWVPVVAPLAAGGLAFTGSTLARYATEGREKSRYRKTLTRYLSPELVKTIMDDFNWEGIHAEKRMLTVLFSDIRGFTSFSEEFPAETVVKTLNEHLNLMVSVIFKHQGTLDKFVGDCVMAFWGAPLPEPRHAERAARAALEMIEGVEKLNQKWQSEGRPTLKIGVGINTGEMLFGNIGSEQRMDFTVIGDAVNLASRLESATRQKELQASIIISDATYQQVRDVAQVRPLGEILVKGKAQKVTTYELLGLDQSGPDEKRKRGTS